MRWLDLKNEHLAALLFSFCAIFAVTWEVDHQFETQLRNEVGNSLSAILQTTRGAVDQWAEAHMQTAGFLAASPQIRQLAVKLLAAQEQSDLRAMQAEPRKKLAWLYQVGRYQGFFFIGPGNINLASSRDTNIDVVNPLIKQPDVLQRLWAGEVVMSRPLTSDIPLADAGGRLVNNAPTMFVGAPVRDTSGRIIALFTLRIDPNQEFYPLLLNARVGERGESYCFDRQGRMLSDSRFTQRLRDSGLLEADGNAGLRLELRDPGRELSTHGKRLSLRQLQPLTYMARAAIQDNAGENLQGYRNYLGVPVVGAWVWDNKLNMGIAIEQDMDEAYAQFYIIQTILYGFALFSALLLSGLAGLSAWSRRKLQDSQVRLLGVVNTVVDGIVVIDEQGCVQSVNPAVEKIFGYQSTELIGQNVNRLMPEPYLSEHDGYMDHYRKTGQQSIIGSAREVTARRKDGSTFPIELGVSKMNLAGENYFTGIISDISDRKAIESSLEQERQFNQLTLDALPAEIAVLNEKGEILYVNDAWRQFADENGLQEVNYLIGKNYLSGWSAAIGHEDKDSESVYTLLKEMLSGQRDNFTFEYPCDDCQERLWFLMRATRFTQGDRQRIVVTHQNVTALKKAEDALKHVNNELHMMALVAQKTHNAVIITDADGRIIWVNNGFTDLCEYTLEEAVGHRPDELLHGPETDPDVAGRLGENVRAGRAFEGEILNYSKSGVPFWLQLEVTPVFNSRGEITEYIALQQDVSEQRRMLQELQAAKEAAEQANHTKSAFLAAMSHEIRTPMNGVVGMADVLWQTDLDHNQKEIVDMVRESAYTLLGIIDDILDFSKIEAGRLELEKTSVNLPKLIEGVGETLLPIAVRSSVELLVYCDPAIPTVMGDPLRLRQILFNLAGNAIKFSGSGKVQGGKVVIRSEAVDVSCSQVSLRFEVRDNGIGMNAEVKAKLFQPFVQGENSTTRRFGGTGLGLSICRRLVDMMHGTMKCDSEPGQGTTFYVDLVLPVKPSSSAAIMDAEFKGLKTLILSQDDFVITTLENYLKHAGALVSTAPTPEVGLELNMELSAGEILVVVIDDKACHHGVAERQRQLQKQFAAVEVRFVVIHRGKGRRRRLRMQSGQKISLDLNALRRDVFLKAVQFVAGRLASEEQSGGSELLSTKAPSNISEAKDRGCLILVAEDNENNRKVLRQQLRICGYNAQMANNGREALDLWRSGCYSLLLTDCHMPEMDGYTLTRTIRSEEAGQKRIPIIAITADALQGTRELCLSSGMDDYVSKPMQLNLLREKLTQWLPSQKPLPVQPSGKSSENRLNAQQGVLSYPPASVDPEALKAALGSDDPQMLKEFYGDFVNFANHTITTLQQAYNASQATEISHLAHRLKSSARTVGANHLADCCLALEQAGKSTNWQLLKKNMQQLPQLFSEARQWILQFTESRVE